MSNSEIPSIDKIPAISQLPPGSEQFQPLSHKPLEKWPRRLILCALAVAFVASFFAYARRNVDFAGYVAVGNAFLDGRDIYLDTPVGINTWPPFFSLASVPLALLDRASPYLARVIWIALNWAAIFWALDLTARLIYGRPLCFRPSENSLDITSPEILVPFALTLPYLINNFELLQINMILFTLSLWGLYLQANGREAAGGIVLGAAAAMKVLAIAFLPYLLYRKRWRASFWLAASSLVFFFSPALILGWPKFWSGVAIWPAALRATWGAGNMHQSVYSMWDRILGYHLIPFAAPGEFFLPLSGARSAKLAWEITCALIVVLGAIAFRGTPRPASRQAQIEWAVVFVAATILSPLTRKPFLVVLLLPYALLYAAWHSTDLDARTRRVMRNVMFASFALSIPTLHDVIGKSLAMRLEMGSVVTFGSLIMLCGLLWYRWFSWRRRPAGVFS